MGKPVCLILGSGLRGEMVDDSFKETFDFHTIDIEPKVKPHTVGDIRDLPFSDESFDSVLCHHVLEHVPVFDVWKSIQNMYRVLKPGGELFVSVPNMSYACEWVLSGKALETMYCIKLSDEKGTSAPITPMDMLFGWGIAIKSGQPNMAHRYGFTRESIFQWFNQGDLKWSLLISHELRMLGEYDRAEIRLYGIKAYEGEAPYEHHSLYTKDCNLNNGDPYKIVDGLHLDRFKKEE